MSVVGLVISAVTVVSISGGCACKVSIWANSDSDSTVDYTRSNPHYAHVGETVQFRITVEPDIASYVVMDLGGDVEVLSKVRSGQYALTTTFDDRWRDRSVKLAVRAYKQVGRRDFVKLRGKAIHRPRAGDQADTLLGLARMTVRCYQSRIMFKLSLRGGGEPDWDAARVEVFGSGDKITRVGLGKPGEHGFVVLGVGAFSGKRIVVYEPRHDELRRTGKTKVVFVLPVKGGQGIREERWIDTR